MILPQLTPNAVADSGVSVPPPPSFRPLRGRPTQVQWKPTPIGSRGRTAAQQDGLRYETKAQKHLKSKIASYIVSPGLVFVDLDVTRILLPDGLVFQSDGTAIIFEIKRQHMPEAWWQLRRLYEPVVRELSFVNRTSCVEVVASFDPAMGFPEPVHLCTRVEEVLEAPAAALKVLLWKP